MRPMIMLAVGLLSLQSVPTWGAEAAASPSTPADDSTFAFVPATGKQLKIDRRNGVVSLCQETAGTWTCQLVADDRKAYEERIAELEAENGRLTERLKALEGAQAAPPADMRSDSERFEEFLDLSDRMFRHFFNMVDEFKTEQQKPI